MNTELSEINSIISICDAMIDEIKACGTLRARNANYEEYKSRIRSFLKAHKLDRLDYGPYTALRALYFTKGYTVYLSEAETIRRIIVDLKHDLFPDSFDKIFISHREKNKEQVGAFVDLLHAIGIPRPTNRDGSSVIFCTSHPASYIENGSRNLEEIRRQFNSSDHIFFILWYSDDYFDSQACLNEAGAIWAMHKKYQEVLMPDFASSKIGGLMDKQSTWFRADDKYRLNMFKAQLESMFSLDPLEQNAWEFARDTFITRITELSKTAEE